MSQAPAGKIALSRTALLFAMHCGGAVNTAPTDVGTPDASLGDSAVDDVRTLFTGPDGALILTVCPVPPLAELDMDYVAIPTGMCVNWPPPPDCPTCAPAVNCVFSVRPMCPNGQRAGWVDWTCGCPMGQWHCIRTDQNGGRCPYDAGNF